MKRNVASVRIGLATALLALGLTAVLGQASCSNQGEGGRCNVLGDNNGLDDCQTGLVCKPKATLNGAQDDLCCPESTAAATNVLCQAPGGGGVQPPAPADATAPDATISVDATTNDAPNDASKPTTDSATDGPVESAADAADDGG